MNVLRTITCCDKTLTIQISDKTPYICPNCGTIYTVKNTTCPNPDIAQYDYLLVLAGGIVILSLVAGTAYGLYLLLQLF